MNLDLLTITLFTTTAVLIRLLVPGKWRGWFLFIFSTMAVYWLQPFTPLRFGDYLLQTVTILLTVLTWWVTRLPEQADLHQKEDQFTLLILFGLVLLVTFNRFLEATWRFTASRPPAPLWVAVGLLVGMGVFALGWQWLRRVERHKLLTAVILLIVILFVLLKFPPLTTAVAAAWRSLTGQQVTLAAPSDLTWLGFSYVAFRLIHTLRDRQTGQLPDLRLREFVTYGLFFPSYIAGPIDRVERFATDYRQLQVAGNKLQVASSKLQVAGDNKAARYWQGGSRIAMGLFKKFVIADSLALGMSLTPANAEQTTAVFWLWLLLYGYALRLFFDFSGYTDIAIGIGLLGGVTLPENFKRPYLTTNITSFWQSWHISLSDWARFYVFSPLSRSLLRRKPRPSTTPIVFISHLTTMIVIGLWHGITFNYLIWGVWHGLALFVHKQWSDHTRKWYRGLSTKPWQKRSWTAITWLLTFHYVVLGWVWFLLPTPALAMQTFGRLFGVGN